jgi:hypothetical protein
MPSPVRTAQLVDVNDFRRSPHCEIVARHFRLSAVFDEPTIDRRTSVGHAGDPLFAVWPRQLPSR